MPASPIVSSAKKIQSVSIVGGGIAGLAAGCALADAGFRVGLFERRNYVGGRASSYEHAGVGEVIDNCQHILVGCCTNLIDLYRRIGAADQIRWFDQITFVEPGGRRSVLAPSGLPAPFHNGPAFLRAAAFTRRDKIAIARGMMAFLRGIPAESEATFGEWLRESRQTEGAKRRFWRPALISALNEDADRMSLHYAAMVIREMFLRSPQAGWMGIPTIPLSDLYGRSIEYIRARGGEVHLRADVEGCEWQQERDTWLVKSSASAEPVASDSLILALSFDGMTKMLEKMPDGPGPQKLRADLAQFEHSPITSVHLWFDREITELTHAALLDSKIDWMYHTSRLQPQRHEQEYVELVISASRSLTSRSREEIIAMAVEELGRFFPVVRDAVLTKAAVVKEVRATYSIRPMLDSVRPSQVAPWPRAFLAGDWTATGWPATMESAVRSGYLAAEALAVENESPQRFLRGDLPSMGLMKLFR